jgi:hypothetical protein
MGYSDFQNNLVWGKTQQAQNQGQGDGSMVPIRLNRVGEMIAAQGGKYAQAALSGRLFSIANQAKVATTAALATPWTGLAVGNPVGSGVLCSLVQFGAAVSDTAVSAAGAVGLMTASSLVTAITASLTPINCMISGASSKVYATAGQTIATPTLNRVVGTLGTVAVTGYGNVTAALYDLDGSLILQPGTFVASYTTAATTATIIFHFVWEEIPI